MTKLPLLGEPLAVELSNTAMSDGTDVLEEPQAVRLWLEAHRDELPPCALELPPADEDLRRLRDAVRELLAAAMDGRDPSEWQLRTLNAVSTAVPSRLGLSWPAGGAPAAFEAEEAADPPQATLAAIARSAIELLTGPDRERLRRCEGEGCGMAFVASNPRRRWCSAAICGNRARVARHYHRHRAAESGESEAQTEAP